jgi:hypothetical protein
MFLYVSSDAQNKYFLFINPDCDICKRDIQYCSAKYGLEPPCAAAVCRRPMVPKLTVGNIEVTVLND